MKIFIAPFFAALLLIGGCAQNSTNEKQSINLRLNPDEGKEYRYDMVNEVRTIMNSNGKDIETSNSMEIGLTYVFKTDSSGNRQLTITYNKFILKSKNKDTEKEINADNAGQAIDPTERIFGAFKDAVFVVKLNKSNDVIQMSGYNELVSKVANIAGQQIAQEQIESMLNSTLGEGFIKKTIEATLKFYPDTTIAIGSTWSNETSQNTDIKLKLRNVYTLTDVKSGTAYIQMNSNVNSANGSFQMAGYNVEANLEGNQKSKLEVDERSGMILSNTGASQVSGTIKIWGKEMKTKIVATNRLNRSL